METLTEEEQQKLDGNLWAGATEIVDLYLKRKRMNEEKESIDSDKKHIENELSTSKEYEYFVVAIDTFINEISERYNITKEEAMRKTEIELNFDRRRTTKT